LPPFGSVGYRFRDHKMIGGILFNHSFELLVNDVNNLNRVNSNIVVNEAQEGAAKVPAGYRVDKAQVPDELSSNKIDEGVYLIGGGGAYTLFVEMQDYVFAAGATGGAADRIAELRKSVPKKPIRYALITHHHNDHIPGSADFSAAGATLVTVAANESVVQAAAGSEIAKLEFVEGVRRFDDGNRAIEVRNIGPTPHAQNLLVVYLPKEGIVFEADHFSLPFNGTLPPSSNNTRAFASAVNDWDFTRLMGAHSPAIASKADLLNVVSGELTAR
jgi:glyoxylase-like metal-dependent hydrolase (beta-lactamase superfamily II)